MYCIGLTGTIASGKSTVAALFQSQGIDVINADDIAKTLVQHDQPALKEIIKHFGASILTQQGELNRRKLRELIVHSTHERVWLENLLHPLIRQQIEKKINLCKSPYCIIEIPLLIDRSAYPYLNRVLLVTADLDQQIARVMTRDNSTKEQALAILATTQSNEDKRRAIADDYLINDGTVDSLRQKVAGLHRYYLKTCT